jgi:hypothetical protein
MSEIKVNSGDWNSLSSEDQDKITKIMTSTGLLSSGVSITPDENTASVSALKGAAETAELGSFCTIACNLAQAAAVAACNMIPPPGNAVCIVAAQAAGDYCRSKC